MLVPAGYHSMQEIEDVCRMESEKLWSSDNSDDWPKFMSNSDNTDENILDKQLAWAVWLVDLLLYENRHNVFAYSFGHEPIKIGAEPMGLAKDYEPFPDESFEKMKEYYLNNGLDYAFVDREYWEITPRHWRKHFSKRKPLKEYWLDIRLVFFFLSKGKIYRFRDSGYYFKQIEKRLKPVKGWSLCFSDAGYEIALATIPNLLEFRNIEDKKRSTVGRPSIKKDLRIAYMREFPEGHAGTWKFAMQKIRQKYGIHASIKTLKRALGKEQ